MQAGAAERLLDRDPAAARETLRSIRAQGRRTLTAMRQLVGIMRASDATPSLSTVEELVAAARDTGMAVTVRTMGTPAGLSPAADVAAYRIVQEALSNARTDGIVATRELAGATVVDPVAVLVTTFDLDEYVFATLRAGASGFLLKDTEPDDLVAAVRVVAAGDGLVAPAVTRRLVAEFARVPGPGPGRGLRL